MQKAEQEKRYKQKGVALLFVSFLLTFAVCVALPVRAFASAPEIRSISQGQTNVPTELGEIEVFFGHNVSAGAVFDENTTHFSLYSSDGLLVDITVYRKYFGYGSPDADNPDSLGLRRSLFVSAVSLQPETTYTLAVSAGVRAFGSLAYDGASVTFTTAANPDSEDADDTTDDTDTQPSDGEGDGGNGGNGSNGGESEGSESGSGDKGETSGDASDAGKNNGSAYDASDESKTTSENKTTSESPEAYQNTASLPSNMQDNVTVAAVDGAPYNNASDGSLSTAQASGLHKFSLSGEKRSGGNGLTEGSLSNVAAVPCFWFALLCCLALFVGMGVQRVHRVCFKSTKKRIEELTQKKA